MANKFPYCKVCTYSPQGARQHPCSFCHDGGGFQLAPRFTNQSISAAEIDQSARIDAIARQFNSMKTRLDGFDNFYCKLKEIFCPPHIEDFDERDRED